MNAQALLDGKTAADRIIALTAAYMQWLVRNPARVGDVPDGATLILLPDDDPELTAYNRRIGERAVDAGENVYFLHIRAADLLAVA